MRWTPLQLNVLVFVKFLHLRTFSYSLLYVISVFLLQMLYLEMPNEENVAVLSGECVVETPRYASRRKIVFFSSLLHTNCNFILHIEMRN